MITDSEDKSMIAELERIVREEEAKPESERDENLIDDCIREIAELKGVKAEFSDEEVAKITDKLIMKTDREKRKKRFVRIVAGVAAVFVLVSGVTACTINPSLINWVLSVCHMPFGSSVEQESTTYILQGSSEEYNSVEELLSTNEIEVYYPTILPNHIKLKSIAILDENDIKILSFKFTSADFRYTIQMHYDNPDEGGEAIAEIEASGLHFTVYSENNLYFAFAEEGGNSYTIQSNNINDIILFVGGLRKE